MTPRIKVPVLDIKVQDRQRQVYSNIDSLATSMSENGLIQPIVVNQDLRLIAGGRRLTAAKQLGWTEIDVVFRETLSEDELQVLELEENTKRSDITWQEHCLAVARIHLLKKNSAAKVGEMWGERETGDLFGVSKGNINYTLKIAYALQSGNKKVLEAATITDAIRVLIQEREDEAIQEMARRTLVSLPTQRQIPADPSLVNSDPLGLSTDSPILPPFDEHPSTRVENHNVYLRLYVNQDCLTWLVDEEYHDFNGTVNAILTDPPYAIDMDYLTQQNGMANIDRVKETHQVDENMDLLQRFVPLAYRALKDGGVLAMWCDIMRWQYLYDLCTAAGFRVQRWPIVWHKTSPCLNQSANKNFTKNVEFCLVAWKGNGFMAKPAASCVITAPNADKVDGHPFTKPRAVWDFLLDYLCIGNSYVIDPFMGVGSSILAFLEAGHRVQGCEIDPVHYARCIENVKQWYLTKDPASVFV